MIGRRDFFFFRARFASFLTLISFLTCFFCFFVLFHSCLPREGTWFFILRLFKSVLFFVTWISLYCFHSLLIIIIIVFWLGSDKPSGLIFLSYPLYFFPYSRLSFYFLLFLCIISFLLVPRASVWENTRAWVPHFLWPYWIGSCFFPTAQLQVHNAYSERKTIEIVKH